MLEVRFILLASCVFVLGVSAGENVVMLVSGLVAVVSAGELFEQSFGWVKR